MVWWVFVWFSRWTVHSSTFTNTAEIEQQIESPRGGNQYLKPTYAPSHQYLKIKEDAHSAEYDSKSSLAHVRNVLNAIFTKNHSTKNRMIEKRYSKIGIPSYRVLIRLKGYPIQTAIFKRMTDAKRWEQQTEAAIKEGRHFKTTESKKHTLAELIDRYSKDVLPTKPKQAKH